MTYRDPDAPLPADAPTEAYRTAADDTPVTPASPAGAAPEDTQSAPGGTAPATGGTEPAPAPSGTGVPPAQVGWPSAGAAATTQPVAGPGPRRGLRWAVAIVVVALVVTTAAAAAFIMAGKAPDATVLRWVPTDSIIYAEARLDLPGDQRAKLAEFLSKFPGFRDQSTLETKINEVLDRAVSGASNGDQTYSADLAPWFGGEVAFSMGELPSMADLSDPESAKAIPEVVTFVSLKDDAKAKAWIGDVIKDAPTTTEDYNGTELTLISTPGGAAAGSMGAWAIPAGSKVLIAGQVDAVKAALDTKGASGLAADAGFSAALAASDDDHVGFMYMNMRSYMDWAMGMSDAAGVDVCGSTLSPELLAMVPDWMGMRLRIEGDALVMDAAGPLPEGLADKPTNRVSTIAARMPASTIALVEGHDVGKGVLDAIEIYRSDPACADAVKQVEGVVGMLGGFDDLVGWIGDAAVVLNRTDDGVEGGLVVQTANADDASDLLATLRSFVALGGSSAGMSIREETHGDTTITILDAGDASSLFGLAGMGAGMTVEPPGGAGSHIELAWAVTDDMVVLSVGPNFIKHVLDTDEAGSLGADARFDSLIQRTGKDNVGIVFADLSAMRELVEGAVAEDAEALAKYEAEVKPFLLPFDAYIQSSSVGGELSQTKAVITIK
jgi:hypothetical protein